VRGRGPVRHACAQQGDTWAPRHADAATRPCMRPLRRARAYACRRCDDAASHASPEHHQSIIRASPEHHQSIIRASPEHHQSIIRASPEHHQSIIRACVHQSIIRASPEHAFFVRSHLDCHLVARDLVPAQLHETERAAVEVLYLKMKRDGGCEVVIRCNSVQKARAEGAAVEVLYLKIIRGGGCEVKARSRRCHC
jgi:hypothetical protein